jgi:hypothetical protein
MYTKMHYNFPSGFIPDILFRICDIIRHIILNSSYKERKISCRKKICG